MWTLTCPNELIMTFSYHQTFIKSIIFFSGNIISSVYARPVCLLRERDSCSLLINIKFYLPHLYISWCCNNNNNNNNLENQSRSAPPDCLAHFRECALNRRAISLFLGKSRFIFNSCRLRVVRKIC